MIFLIFKKLISWKKFKTIEYCTKTDSGRKVENTKARDNYFKGTRQNDLVT